jgi:acetylornithine/N-succinyldiaminopimelate aminotransferase
MIASHAPADGRRWPRSSLRKDWRKERSAGRHCWLTVPRFWPHALMDALSTPGFQERVQNRSWYLEDQLSALFYRRRAAFMSLSGLAA